jgi:hypothetical protein
MNLGKEEGKMTARSLWLPAIVVGGALFLAGAKSRASEGCSLFAEVSVEAVKQGSLQVCVRTGHPVACAIAAASRDTATSGVAKKGVTAGCDWLVEKVGKFIRIRVKAGAMKAAEVGKTKDALKKSKDIRWRERGP